MPGLIINGSQYEIAGLSIANFIDNPKMKLSKASSYRLRTKAELENIVAVVIHTSKGIPGGKNLTPQSIRPGSGKSSNAGVRIAQMWANDSTRKAGAHLVVDFDGQIYCLADLLLHATYHAEKANGRSIGIEMTQNADGSLYQVQIENTVGLVDAIWSLTDFFTIEPRVRWPYKGPASQLAGYLTESGVFGHRDLTSNRGAGDPGDYIIQALIEDGYAPVQFD